MLKFIKRRIIKRPLFVNDFIKRYSMNSTVWHSGKSCIQTWKHCRPIWKGIIQIGLIKGNVASVGHR